MGTLFASLNPRLQGAHPMTGLKLFAKSLLKPLIYRFPPIMLKPERLMLWQQTLIETMDVEGDIIEVGCYLGGTAAVSAKMMKNLDSAKPYRVYDTFSGFRALGSRCGKRRFRGRAKRVFREFAKSYEMGPG
jgi:hypothetical protein